IRLVSDNENLGSEHGHRAPSEDLGKPLQLGGRLIGHVVAFLDEQSLGLGFSLFEVSSFHVNIDELPLPERNHARKRKSKLWQGENLLGRLSGGAAGHPCRTRLYSKGQQEALWLRRRSVRSVGFTRLPLASPRAGKPREG